MELLTKDTHLDFSEDGSTWNELYGMESFPDMGAAPPKVKVTNMRDKNERYIDGIPDISELKFGFFYNKEAAAESGTMIRRTFSKLKSLSGKQLYWRLVYPDGSYYSWEGKPSVYMNGGNTGEAIKYTLSTTLESDLDWGADVTKTDTSEV